jgi:hypothetical protein
MQFAGQPNLSLEIGSQTRYPRHDFRGDAHVVHEPSETSKTQEPGRVLKFPLRGRHQQPLRNPLATPDGDEPIDDLAQYEEEDREIDYRHRMIMNVIAVAVVALLVGAGVWLADTIADMQKIQDCMLQGRQNCAPIDVPPLKR